MKTILGRATKGKHPFDWSHSVTTTAQFGFCQPACNIIECCPGDSFQVKFGQFVRLMPMNLPTFGKVSLRTMSAYVNIEDIWHPWPSFLAGKPYNSPIVGKYIPTTVPFSTDKLLTKFMLSYSIITAYSCSVEEFNSNFRLSDLSLLDQGSAVNYYNMFKNGFYFGSHGQIFIQSSQDPAIVTKDNADFVFSLRIDDQTHVLLCFRLTDQGNDIYKILKAAGIQPNFQDDKTSILPIFAYYKAYFDLMQPKNLLTWKETKAFEVLEYAEQNNISDFSLQENWVRLVPFLEQLTNMPYFFNADFVSSHISGTVQQSTANTTPIMSVPASETTENAWTFSTYQKENANVPAAALGSYVIQKAIQIMSIMANKDTAIGGRIKEYMLVHGLGQYLDNPEAINVGAQKTEIEISDIMATSAYQSADVDQTLGEFAGQGRAMKSLNEANAMHVNAKAFGYFCAFMAVIPESNYCQMKFGTNYHFHRNDFWHPEFEGLTLKPTRQNEILGEENVSSNFFEQHAIDRNNTSFGNIPIYAEYKHMPNLLNGNISRRSYRSSLLPYSLDKYLTLRDFTQDNRLFRNPILACGNEWRACDSRVNAWLGNFHRIFQNSPTEQESVQYEPYEDPFIIHEYVQISGSSYRVPMSESFDTESFIKNTFEIEKA